MMPLVQDVVEWLTDTGWPRNDSGVLVMFKVAFDESGTHENASVLCVAACVATSTQWTHLVRAWSPIVRVLPHGYHAKRKDCRDANHLLAGLIARRCALQVSVTVDVDEYKRVAPRKFQSIYGSAYTVAVLGCMFRIGSWCHGHKHKWAKYVFESGHRHQPNTQRLLNGVMDTPNVRRRMLMFSHEWIGKGEMVLHAPDLISHEVASCYGKGESDILQALPLHEYTHLGADEILETVEDVRRAEHKERHASR